jgi:hypothetical protein
MVHDGIETSSNCIQEGNLSHIFPHTLRKAYQRKVTVAIYADLKNPELKLTTHPSLEVKKKGEKHKDSKTTMNCPCHG